MKTKKAFLSLLLVLSMLSSLMVAPVSAAAAPTLTITPSVTTISKGTGTATVVYTIEIDPNGNSIGAFAFELHAPEGMTLSATEVEEKDGAGYWTNVTELMYMPIAGYKNNPFSTFEYAPVSGYFGAAGGVEGRTLTTKKTVMTIQATVDISADKTYTLGVTKFLCGDILGNSLGGDTPTVGTVTVGTPTPPTTDKYTVTLNPGAGTGSPYTVDVSKDSAGKYPYTLPSNGGTFTAPAGKAFMDWESASGSLYCGGATIDLTGNLTLTARWGTPIAAANFLLNGYAVGSGITSASIAPDTTTKAALYDNPDSFPATGDSYGKCVIGSGYDATTGEITSQIKDASAKFAESTTYYLGVILEAAAGYSLKDLQKATITLRNGIEASAAAAEAVYPMGDGCAVIRVVFKLDPIAHSHSFTVENAVPAAKKSDANCQSAAVYYKSCACGAISTSDTETFTSGTVDTDTHVGTPGGWTNVGDGEKHYKKYSGCSHTAASAPHAYDNNFDATCNDCSFTRTLYTVTFAKGDTAASGTMTDVKVVGSYTLPACGFTAPSGKQFKAWSVSGTEKAVGAAIDVTSAVTVTAVWEDIPASSHTVTVQNDGHGTASATPASAVAGTTITLTHSASTGFHFKEWQVVSGGVTISGNSFVMPDNDVTVKAIFEADAPVLTPVTAVSLTLGGYALDSKVTEATLSVTTTPASALAPVSAYGTTPASSVTTYMIGTGFNAATGRLEGVISNTSAKFAADTDYYLAVIMSAAAGYSLKDLTKNDVKLGTKTADNVLLNPTDSTQVGAIFKLDKFSGTPTPPTTYTVTVNGSEATTTGAGSYAKEATVTINAGTKSGCIFNGWTTTDSGVTFANAANASTTFTMPDHAVTVTANWLTNVYSANYTIESGYTVGGKITDLTVSGTNTGIKALGAYGTGYTVYKDAGMANAVTVGSDEVFAAGTDCWLKINTIPETGYAVNNLLATNCKLDGVSAINIGHQFYLFKLAKLTTPPAGTHSVTVVGGGTGATGAGNYSTGATVTINAGTKDGYVFNGWTTTDGVTFTNAASASTTFSMPDKDVTVTANWLEKVTAVNFSLSGHTLGAPISALTVSTSTTGLKPLDAYGIGYYVALNDSGTSTPAAGATFAAGTDYYLGIYILAADGYTLTGLTKDNAKLGTETAIDLSLLSTTSDPYACAVFKLAPLSSGAPTSHTVTVQNDGNGTASASATSAVAGTTINLTYTANTGFHFKEWQVVSGGVTISGNSFVMPDSDVTVKAIFEADTTPPAPTHTHSYGAWSKDATNHWHECTDTACPDKSGSVKDLHVHTYDSGADTDCNDCGYIRTVSPSKPSGGSSSSSRETTYPITVKSAKHGDVSSNRKSAASGTTVTITVDPDKGYDLETLTVLDKNGKEIKVTAKSGKYTFKMPASKVTVEAVFAEDNSMLNFFVDVPADAYYADAVLWAAENGITGGVDEVHFAPNAACTRAQIVTFLWRAAGSPAPKTVSSFTDVSADAYYADAVAWAVENGITGGMGDGRFAPNATCTRAQAVTFLYRAAGSPAVGITADFTDVAEDAYYANAVAWAAENGITGGIGGLFGSNNNCTRAQIVTFLYRSMK